MLKKNSILLFSRISGQISIRCNPSENNLQEDNMTKPIMVPLLDSFTL